jgi:hypothetical protein
MSMIWHLALQRIKSHLDATLNAELTKTDDPTYVDVIKIGRFLENPMRQKNGVIVTLNSGDGKDPYYVDGIATNSEIEKIGFRIPTWEIGGEIGGGVNTSSYWWRRGRAELGCWYVGGNRLPDEETAHDSAYIVLGKLIKAIETTAMQGLKDEFGEGAVKLFVTADSFYPSGGNNQYIFRGDVKFQILTWRP